MLHKSNAARAEDERLMWSCCGEGSECRRYESWSVTFLVLLTHMWVESTYVILHDLYAPDINFHLLCSRPPIWAY